MQSLNFIAILGFAKQIDSHQALLAEQAAQRISECGYGVGVGNVSGTFEHALSSAKASDGITMAIIEQDIGCRDLQNCDILQIVSTQSDKHKALANQCSGALVIGGGDGTLELIEEFLENKKRIVAIANSGGIVPKELNASIEIRDDVDSALQTLLCQATSS